MKRIDTITIKVYVEDDIPDAIEEKLDRVKDVLAITLRSLAETHNQLRFVIDD